MRRALVPAIQAAIARYVYRSQQYVIFGDGLAGPPAVDRLEDIVFRLATPSDLEHLDELEPYNRGSPARPEPHRHDTISRPKLGGRRV